LSKPDAQEALWGSLALSCRWSPTGSPRLVIASLTGFTHAGDGPDREPCSPSGRH